MAKNKVNQGSKSAVAVILALLVVGGGVTACGYVSRDAAGKWYGNSDISTWHWADKAPEQNGDEGNTGNEGNAGDNTPGNAVDNVNVVVTVPLAGEAMRIAATPMTTSGSVESYTLTATVSPTDATYQAVDWLISWKDASSSWATGKPVTDYCIVTPKSDGALTATLTCYEAFAEQINVTVVSRDDSSKTATCKVDYRKRLLGVTTSLTNGYGQGGTFSENDATDNAITLKVYKTANSSNKYSLNVTLNESIGTIDNDYSYDFYLFGSDDLCNLIQNGKDIYGSRPSVKTATNHSIYNKFTDNNSSAPVFTETFLFSNVLYMDLDWYEDDYRAACNELIGRLSQWSNEFLLAPTLYVTYDGNEYSYAYRAKLDVSDIKVAVSNVGVNDNVIF